MIFSKKKHFLIQCRDVHVNSVLKLIPPGDIVQIYKANTENTNIIYIGTRQIKVDKTGAVCFA